MTVQELIQEALNLTPAERQQLVQALADMPQDPPERSITELAGLGADLWKEVDAQQYINNLRDEWDDRS
ncbi:MAG: hypothetical protein AAF787_08730 [Chloroflexota bacterium]